MQWSAVMIRVRQDRLCCKNEWMTVRGLNNYFLIGFKADNTCLVLQIWLRTHDWELIGHRGEVCYSLLNGHTITNYSLNCISVVIG